MKKSGKGKCAEANKGNKKIIDFFLKKSGCSIRTQKNEDSAGCTITLEDSDEEFQKTTVVNKRNKENITTGLGCSNESISKKRKHCVEEQLLFNTLPSTSENGNKTPTKNSTRQLISVKSPEHLLSPEALKLYRTPEKQTERFLARLKTPTPKKLYFEEDTSIEHTLLSKVHEISKIRTENGKNSPKKITPIKISKDKEEITPSKAKRAKLFHKSPNDINKFKVQVIDEFVKITPSKSSSKTCDNDVIFVKSSEKKQSSILSYVSPSASKGSYEAQQFNELTPKKKSDNEVFKTPTSKVKTKLDFNVCQLTKSKENSMPNEVDTLDNIVCLEFDDEWGEDFVLDSPKKCNLDLGESQHCKILKIDPFPSKSILTLECTKTCEQARCILEGFWVHIKLSVGDIVHVCAKKLNNAWVVDNEHGLLVYEPDLLVSTTAVAGSLWCKRRSILQEYFRGFEPTNKVMLIGTLVHSLLQYVLRKKVVHRSNIEKALTKLIEDPKTIRAIYECGLTAKMVEDDIMKFVPNIEQFIKLYISNSGSNGSYKKGDWKGRIDTVEDIEENIWCTELGLKGKVDISVKSNSQMIPLELKTGRATMSLEHRGQVMMYIMMMNKLGYNVQSGLLLYLREGVLKEVPITQKEKRDIMILRNELTYYLTRKPRIVDGDNMKFYPPELPEPIHHPSCEKCPYNIICTSYAKYNDEDLSSNKILSNIQKEALSHLSDSHLNYFMKWLSLTIFESSTQTKTKALREIYTMDPKQREIKGKCIIDLKVIFVGDDCNDTYEHTFEKMDKGGSVNFYANGIIESNYVVVSTNARPAVASGFVTNITASTITVTLDRNLNQKYLNKTFHLDTYESSSLQSYNLASLTLLLELSPRSTELRNIIIDKVPPNFKPTLPRLICTKGKQILRRLNRVQQRAVLRAISSEDYFLIKGMPGTGKTTTIVALIQLLYELGKSIIITSHTHSAVDNVCIKLLKYGVKMLRLGSVTKIHPELREYSEYNLTKNCTNPEQLEEIYNKAQIIAVTCLGSSHSLLTKRTVDVCIIDESTQVLQCSLIRPLYAAKTFILIGDPEQLTAVVKNREARMYGMTESLFERLSTPEATSALNVNYRMNSMITSLANEVTYNGELVIDSDDVAKATIKLKHKELLKSLYSNMKWLTQSLDDALENSVQFLDTGPVWQFKHDVPWKICKNSDNEICSRENRNYSNIYEAAIAATLVKALIKLGVDSSQIGVIATYRSQVAQISSLLKLEDVDVSTVDQFQGKDKSIIIYSCTESLDDTVMKKTTKFELLEDKRRLTVAITRAKHKLILIGDIKYVAKYSTFQKLIPFVDKNLIRLQESEEFSWKDLFDSF